MTKRFAVFRVLFLGSVALILIVIAHSSPAPVAAKTYWFHAQTTFPLGSDGQLGGQTTAVAARDGIAYVGVGPRLLVYDTLDRSSLGNYSPLGYSAALSDIIRDIVIGDGYAYVAAGAAGLHIYDISNPATPQEVGSLPFTASAIALDLVGTTLYLGDAGPGGLHIIDVSDPTAPREMGAAEWRAGIWEVSVAGNYAYVADGYDMFIFDVGDPTAPRQIGQVGTSCGALDVAVVGTMAYIADHDNCGLLLADVSDPTVQTNVVYADPQEVFYLNPQLPERDQHNSLLVEANADGRYIFVVNTENFYYSEPPYPGAPRYEVMLTMFDLADPARPDPMHRVSLTENRLPAEITDMYYEPGRLYLTDAAGGLIAVGLTDVGRRLPVSHNSILGPVQGVGSDGIRNIAATPHHIYGRITEADADPFQQPWARMESAVEDLSEANGAGYITTEDGSLLAYDLLALEEGAAYDPLGRRVSIGIDESGVIGVYREDDRLYFVDVRDPGNPIALDSMGVPEGMTTNPRLVMGDGIAFLFASYNDDDFGNNIAGAPYMVDIRGTAVSPAGFLTDVPQGDHLVVVDHIAYYPSFGGGLLRFDVRDPYAPQELGPLPDLDAAETVIKVGRSLLLVHDGSGRLHLYNAAGGDPRRLAVLDAPYLVAPVTYGRGIGIGARLINSITDGDQIIIAAGDAGLWHYTVPGLAASAEEPPLVFDNFPLSEALLLYIDHNADLVLEDVAGGERAYLAPGQSVVRFDVSPTRDTILYKTDGAGRAHLISLDFYDDHRLLVRRLPLTLPSPSDNAFRPVHWAPDGRKFAYITTNEDAWMFATNGTAFTLAPQTTGIFGWSHDSEWLAFCSSSFGLNLGRLGETPEDRYLGVDDDIACANSIFGGAAAWSPTARQLAYVKGDPAPDSSLSTQLTIFDVDSGRHMTTLADHAIIGWAPDGRSLALGQANLGMHAFHVDPVELVGPQGNRLMTLPGGGSDTMGRLGWWPTYNGETIFINQLIAADFSAAVPVADALLAMSADGRRWITGRWNDPGLEVFCGTPDTPYEHSLLNTEHDTFPDESVNPLDAFMRPAVNASLSPLGNFVVLQFYQGGTEWLTRFLPCDPAQQMPVAGQTEWTGFAEADYSADEQWLILESWMSGGENRQTRLINMRSGIVNTPRDLSYGYDSPTWLITPNSSPPVTQVNAIAGRVTDHTGAPIPGARVRAAGPGDPLETTTGNDGRYRFEEPPAGEYTVTADLVGYVFSTPSHVTIPPNQLNVDFAAEPPAAYTLSGRVADCAGRPVSGATVSFDLSGNGARTNADGRYIIEGLERKSYTLTPAAEGYDFVPATRAVHLARYAAGETLTVDFMATTSGSDEFCIPHLEIIQVVQDEFNSAPIIADKPALLRAYVHCPACDPDETITGMLEAFRPEDGTAIPASGAPLIGGMSNPGPEFTLNAFRGDLERSLNFLLPPEWLEEGNTRFRVSANGASATMDVAFEPGKPLRINYILFDFHDAAPDLGEPTVTPPSAPVPGITPPPPAFPPNQAVIDEGFDALRTMLPIAPADLVYVAQLSVVQLMNIPFDRDGTPRMNAERYLDVLNDYWLRMEQASGWRDGLAPDRLFGWVTTSAGTLPGIAYPRFLGNPGSVAAARADDQTHTRLQYSIGAFALVHELGHLLDDEGLEHTPFINETPGCFARLEGSAAEDYPEYLTEGSIGEWGIHISGPTFELLDPNQTFDIMSYCVPYWISLHNYKRFHEGFMPVATAPATPNAAPEPHLLISGRVISSTQTADIDPVFQIQAVAPPSPDTPGDTCVELRDATDVMQERRCFAPVFREGITGGPTDAAGFTLAVPWVEGATSVVVTRDDRVLGRVEASPDPPVVDAATIAGELSADGQLMTVRWGGNDPDGDELVYTLSLRGERGLIPLAFDIHEEEVSFDTRQLPGDEPLHIVIEASDGFHSTRAESAAPMVLPTKPPSVLITPMPESQLTAGRPFWAFGMAHDVEDGPLPDDALVWSAGGQELGRGPQLFTTLPAGEYTLTLTATDSDGRQAAAEWPVYVIENSGPEEKEPNPEGNAATLRRLIGWVAIGSGAVFVIGVVLLLLGRRK